MVKYSDGTLVRVPVLYGDPERQTASIIRQGSENVVNSSPRIAVYVSGLDLDRERLGDSTYVGKVHIREREFDPTTNSYNNNQGRNYTVERIMPTPFKLTMKIDIWSANTDQKLQILEQILVFFNPTLELQTTDNSLDWTSLSMLNLITVNWSSRSQPVGSDSPIDIATITVDAPIWISPPVKVKQLGVINHIITSFWQNSNTNNGTYIEGLGVDPIGSTTTVNGLMTTIHTTISDYNIQVYNGQAILLSATEQYSNINATLDISKKVGLPVNWQEVFDLYPGKFIPGASRLFLIQPTGFEINGTIQVAADPTMLDILWDQDTLNSNTGIDSNGLLETDIGYNAATSFRPNSPGTFDAIINPLTFNPKRPTNELLDIIVNIGTRYLIIEDIGNVINHDGADAWKSIAGTDFVAHANDIVEWQGSNWRVIFNSNHEADTSIYQTNIYTGVQYLWNGVSWVKSFEGEYPRGKWRIEL